MQDTEKSGPVLGRALARLHVTPVVPRTKLTGNDDGWGPRKRAGCP